MFKGKVKVFSDVEGLRSLTLHRAFLKKLFEAPLHPNEELILEEMLQEEKVSPP